MLKISSIIYQRYTNQQNQYVLTKALVGGLVIMSALVGIFAYAGYFPQIGVAWGAMLLASSVVTGIYNYTGKMFVNMLGNVAYYANHLRTDKQRYQFKVENEKSELSYLEKQLPTKEDQKFIKKFETYFGMGRVQKFDLQGNYKKKATDLAPNELKELRFMKAQLKEVVNASTERRSKVQEKALKNLNHRKHLIY